LAGVGSNSGGRVAGFAGATGAFTATGIDRSGATIIDENGTIESSNGDTTVRSNGDGFPGSSVWAPWGPAATQLEDRWDLSKTT
jgi:hypothetical protein